MKILVNGMDYPKFHSQDCSKCGGVYQIEGFHEMLTMTWSDAPKRWWQDPVKHSQKVTICPMCGTANDY